MNGFSIFMFIFAACIFLTGIYMYSGHKLGILTGRPSFENLSKNEWKNVGKWTIFVSVIPFILGIIGLIFKI